NLQIFPQKYLERVTALSFNNRLPPLSPHKTFHSHTAMRKQCFVVSFLRKNPTGYYRRSVVD
ncbi:hypothetical protein K0E94_21340, partial [Bacteroides fragilis]|nr:hypothetical protein [Bacteroides fragilis]